MSVFLYISDIASYIGQNYFDPTKSFERLWKRIDKENIKVVCDDLFRQLEEKKSEITLLQSKKETRKTVSRIKELKSEIEHIELSLDLFSLSESKLLNKEFPQLHTVVNDHSLSLQEKKRKVESFMESSTVTETDKSLDSHRKSLFTGSFYSYISKNHGIRHEESSIEKYESKFGVKLDVSQQMYKRSICLSKSGKEYILCGKMDGIDNVNNKIIEVKNRTNGFFSEVRDYEMTQMQLYMFLTGLDNCELVEEYNKQIKITHVTRDDIYINTLLRKIEQFVCNLEDFIHGDHKMKSDYILGNSDYKKKFILKRLIPTDKEIVQTMCLL